MTNSSKGDTTKKESSCTKEPLVSINCLVFNHAPYLRECFDGFVTQKTNFPFEVLVHDDASTDLSADIIREYTAKYPNLFKPIYQTENQYSKGVKISYVYQYPRARGKYIALCEGDDYWTDPNKLQMQVDFLESHPDYSMCFHAAKIKKDVDLFTHAECEKVEDRDYKANELLDHWVIPTASIVMRRECLFFPLKNANKIVYGDYFLVFSCLSIGKLRGIPRTMSVYRVNSGSITHNPEQKKKNIVRMPGNWECFKENFPFVSQKKINRTIAFHYWQRARIQPSFKLALQDRKKSFLLSPIISFLLIFRPLFLAVMSLPSKYFDTSKLRLFIQKIINHF